MELPPFYIGQEVVCVKSHSLGAVKKSLDYTILSIKRVNGIWIVDVGVRIPSDALFIRYTLRESGEKITMQNDGKWWILADLFTEKEEKEFKQITYIKILEQEPIAVN